MDRESTRTLDSIDDFRCKKNVKKKFKGFVAEDQHDLMEGVAQGWHCELADEEPPPPGLEGDQSDDDEDDTVLAKLKVTESKPKPEIKKRKRSESMEPETEENKSDVEMEDICVCFIQYLSLYLCCNLEDALLLYNNPYLFKYKTKKLIQPHSQFQCQSLKERNVHRKCKLWFHVGNHPNNIMKSICQQMSATLGRNSKFENGFELVIYKVKLDFINTQNLLVLLDYSVTILGGGCVNFLGVLDFSDEVLKFSEPVLNFSEAVLNFFEEVLNLSKEVLNLSKEVLNLSKEVLYLSEAVLNFSKALILFKAVVILFKVLLILFKSDKEDSTLKLDKPSNEEEEEEPKKVEGEVTVKTEEKPSEPEEPKPRPLHRTVSIFLRTLAPSITKQEVEAMCQRYPGFMRVAIADPQPERKWFRRGWVTFERHVNIKEICWNLNNIRLRDCELGALVNRDLSRRIRTVSGITVHKQVVRNDIKNSARIVHNLDSRNGLWLDKEDSAEIKTEDVSVPSFGLVSKNPVLKNITDYLIEEAPAEEEELLGHSGDHEDGQLADDSGSFERDETLIMVLDRLLLYLRIVHSVDYYNHCEYPNEDEMPNRCGIMHARATPPTSKVTPQELSDYCRMFENKVSCFLQPPAPTLDEDYDKLGCKDPDIEVEKFIQSNTQELAKDKWLCPLSGKKFKGPEFVRKHIFNKHAEKVEEVKKEEQFDTYKRDAKRLSLVVVPGQGSQKIDYSKLFDGNIGDFILKKKK
ncbi:hypothetical protein PR048_031518 [Dryococelus australis]|uniref:SERRATE/Ars2 C-terminal domain-containing protein n=1 Tax=Dryococelus australis TaxID=614101 RepID=A0ABQ9G5I3_9NEOP|nr:hypothetical protein PR048_031518 [Dryococelus australis]